MKINKKTLYEIDSMLKQWHGAEEGRNSFVNFHPHPLAINNVMDKVIARALPPWERKLNQVKQSWTEITGAETARRCQVAYLSQRVLYIEVFHPAYRIALDNQKIKAMLLQKVQEIIGEADCKELKFIPVGRTSTRN